MQDGATQRLPGLPNFIDTASKTAFFEMTALSTIEQFCEQSRTDTPLAPEYRYTRKKDAPGEVRKAARNLAAGTLINPEYLYEWDRSLGIL
jgi:hypothetical protein